MEGRSVRGGNDTVSVVGPGMRVEGDCHADGTIRIEGTVRGSVHARKAVVVGPRGRVEGDIETQDAVVGGTVEGTIRAQSRLELQESCRVTGDLHSRRVKLEEGGYVDGRIRMGAGDGGSGARSPQSAEGSATRRGA